MSRLTRQILEEIRPPREEARRELAVPTIDGLLAATARVGDLTFVTRNTPDLVHTGVRLLDPFAPHE